MSSNRRRRWSVKKCDAVKINYLWMDIVLWLHRSRIRPFIWNVRISETNARRVQVGAKIRMRHSYRRVSTHRAACTTQRLNQTSCRWMRNMCRTQYRPVKRSILNTKQSSSSAKNKTFSWMTVTHFIDFLTTHLVLSFIQTNNIVSLLSFSWLCFQM